MNKAGKGEAGMPQTARVLTHQQAKAFYDWMGTKQDLQAFYEGPATRDLIMHADFAEAHAVFECGCGTGAFAEQVLASHLPPDAHYVAVDSSTTMIRLAKARLTRFGSRVGVRQTDGVLQFQAASGSFDRFVSNYVIDLLSIADIALLLSEAHRMLAPQGYLCLVSLTHGSTWPSRLVTELWTRIHALRPALVGGCRPLALRELLPATHWQVMYANVLTAFGIPSEVIVAQAHDYDL
jgi:ubiquinone/menaquinone biosynthesis C-methylase UbiE